MNKRFDCTADVPSATPKVFRLYNNTDNPTYDDQDGPLPARKLEIRGFRVSTNKPVKFEVGRCKADASGFVPVYATMATFVAGGKENMTFAGSFPLDLVNADLALEVAIRLTAAADQTGVTVCGDVDIHRP